MTDIELMIGQSSTEAERKRAARLENKALLPPRTNGGHLSDIRPPEIEIKKEIDIEIEKERELKPGRAAPAAYGRYKNVILTDTELSELKAELPTNGSITLTGYPAISLLPGGNTRTMPPLSADGRLTIPLKLPRKRAYPITATRREKVYETSF